MEILFAFRNLVRRPFLNLIKIAGLSLGLTGTILILLYIKSEWSYDRYHQHAERIFRFTTTDNRVFDGKHFARLFYPYHIPEMAGYFPGIESYVRLVPVRGGVIRYNDRYYRVNEGFQCDSTFFHVFDAELVSGNAGHILDQPASMVVSESFARKIFAHANPVGQTLSLPSGQFYGRNIDFTIRGIMKDFPYNSHFHPEFIATPDSKDEFKGWAWTYLLLYPESRPEQITDGYRQFQIKVSTNDSVQIQAHLQALTQIHLHSDKLREIEPNGNLFVIFTLAAAAIILLVVSLINYVNLNLGMAVYSDKYLYVSKVYGSSVFTRIRYHVAEGLIVIVCSVLLSILVTGVANIFLMKHFNLDLIKGNTLFVTAIIVLFGILGILSTLLIFLKNGIQKIQTDFRYKGSNGLHRKGISKGLIVFQYAISTALVVAVIVMIRQTRFALKESLGEDSGTLICMEDVHSDVQKKFAVFKQELLKYKTIRSVTGMLDPPGGEANDMFNFEMEGYSKNDADNKDHQIGILPCDYSFADVFDLNFLAGEDFSPVNVDHEGSGEYIINRAALKKLGYTQPEDIIGKSFRLLFGDESIQIPAGRIIGVVDDFHLSGLKKKVEPLVLFKRHDMWLINYVVRCEPGMYTKALSDMEQVWKKMFPEHPFEFRAVSSIYRYVYRSEMLQSRLLLVFTIIALFMCSMGLLGLSLLTAQKRTKEIGIRVVHGAGSRQILGMLNWYFIRWISISLFISLPLAWYGMNRWLENFAYKVPLSAWIFVVAAITTLFIALVTISVQSWSASRRNPVDALRYE